MSYHLYGSIAALMDQLESYGCIMVGTYQAGSHDSDYFQKAIRMVLRCILNVISHLSESGFSLVSPMLYVLQVCAC